PFRCAPSPPVRPPAGPPRVFRRDRSFWNVDQTHGGSSPSIQDTGDRRNDAGTGGTTHKSLATSLKMIAYQCRVRQTASFVLHLALHHTPNRSYHLSAPHSGCWRIVVSANWSSSFW